MEIELKYKIPSALIADDIWDDKIFSDMEEEGSREELDLDAKYFDTDECELARNKIAYRIREEGGNTIAALKWKGGNEGALHMREEMSVPVQSGEPDLSVFGESEMGRTIIDTIDERRLICFLETKFKRRRFRIDTGTGIFELSIDMGEIITQYGELPISEVEIELFSGENDELMQLGKKLQDKYGLETEEQSKYARGIAMIKHGRADALCV